MLELEEALQRRFSLRSRPLRVRTISQRRQAHGRVLAGTQSRPDRSARRSTIPPMDGYAVRAQDIAAAQTDSPVRLRLRRQSRRRRNVRREMSAPDECVRLFTGSPLPRGADAVVMQEDTRVDASEAGRASNRRRRSSHGKTSGCRGEDVKRGATLMEPGVRYYCRSHRLLAASGRATVPVGRRPLVGLLATGSELREAGEALSPGQIYESNRAGTGATRAAMRRHLQNFPDRGRLARGNARGAGAGLHRV